MSEDEETRRCDSCNAIGYLPAFRFSPAHCATFCWPCYRRENADDYRAEGAAAERARTEALLAGPLDALLDATSGDPWLRYARLAVMTARARVRDPALPPPAVRSASPSAVGEDTEPETSFKMPPALKVRLEEDR